MTITSDFIDMVNNGVKRSSDNWGTGIILQHPQTGKILLAKRTDTGEYGTPGGKVEYQESPKDGVLRECLEESNIKVNDMLCYGNNLHTAPNGKNWVDFLFYSNSFDDSNIQNQPSEMEPFSWYSIEDALNLNLFPPSRTGLEIAIENGILNSQADETNYIKYVNCPTSASSIMDSPACQYSYQELEQTYEGKLISPWIYWD